MPANTTKGWPYVTGADVVADYPTTSAALANKADASVAFAQAAGKTTLTWAAAVQSDVVTVTFPASRFSVVPIVVLGLNSAPSGTVYAPRLASISATSMQLVCTVSAAISGTGIVGWHAIQMRTTAADG